MIMGEVRGWQGNVRVRWARLKERHTRIGAMSASHKFMECRLGVEVSYRTKSETCDTPYRKVVESDLRKQQNI